MSLEEVIDVHDASNWSNDPPDTSTSIRTLLADLYSTSRGPQDDLIPPPTQQRDANTDAADFTNGWDVGVLQRALDQCTNNSGNIEDCSVLVNTRRSGDEMNDCVIPPRVAENVDGCESPLASGSVSTC